MKILYIGDIMARPGIDTIKAVLPDVLTRHKPDFVIAQAENVTDGSGMSLSDMRELKSYGIDAFSGGNHTPALSDLHASLSDPAQPVIGPANLPSCPGPGWKLVSTDKGDVLMISILGSKVGRQVETKNPLKFIDHLLDELENLKRVATIVNFHGDYSSEKRIFGYYLDGRVTAVIGDHWHVPTADAMILPRGTAHMTDVGMCGSLHSSLGVSLGSVIPRWRDEAVTKNEIEESRPYQFNAVLITTGANGLAESIEPLHQIIN